jgi:hypothetical protein
MTLSLPGGTLRASANVIMPRSPLNHKTTWSISLILELRNWLTMKLRENMCTPRATRLRATCDRGDSVGNKKQ